MAAGYRFADNWYLGLPLDALIVAAAVPLILWVWPLWARAYSFGNSTSLPKKGFSLKAACAAAISDSG